MTIEQMANKINSFLQAYRFIPINDWYDGRVSRVYGSTVYSCNCFGEQREWKNCTASDINFIYQQTFQPVYRSENF